MVHKLLILTVLLWCFQIKALDIAVRGKAAEYTIVIAKPSTKPMENAANEFQKHVEEITGVRLPIVQDDKPLPRAAVLIGDTKYSKALLGDKYDLDALKDDAFRLKAVGPHVVVLGGKRGGQYGVYELLERFGGCGWYASWHSVIPKREKFSIPSDLDEVQHPAFLSREPFWYDMFNTYQALRNKCNGFSMRLGDEVGGRIRYGGGLFNHSFDKLVPVAEFYDSHPEYFSEIRGRRADRKLTQLCLANPDVLRILTERVLERIRKDPTGYMYTISHNDNGVHCECEKCMALLKKYGNRAGMLVWFVNQVAEQVEKVFPDVRIMTVAYEGTREPPPEIKPRRNVIVRLAAIECDHAHPIQESKSEKSRQFLKDIKKWASISRQLFIWDYVTNFSHYVSPYPNFPALQKNLQFFRDCGAMGVLSQGDYNGHHGDFAELKGWITAKLMWNPDQDVEQLLDRFFTGYYGAAAPFVREYFNELNKLVEDENTFLGVYHEITGAPLTDEFLARGAKLWEQAEDAVKDNPAYLYNVRSGAMSVYYAQLFRLPEREPSYEWQDERIVPDKAFAPYYELSRKLMRGLDDEKKLFIRLSEGNGKDARIERIRKMADSYGVKTIRKGAYVFGVSPEFNGIGGILRAGDGSNILNGNHGGISCAPLAFGSSSNGKVVLEGKGDDWLTCKGEYANDIIQRNTFKLDEGGLLATFLTANKGKKEEHELPVVAEMAFSLDVSGNVCYRFGDGEWRQCAVSQGDENATLKIGNDVISSVKSISICSPKSGRGAKVCLEEGTVDFMILELAPKHDLAKLRIFRRNDLAPDEETSMRFRIISFKDCDCGFTPLAYKPDSAVRISLPGSRLRLIRRGSWGDFVVDEKSMDGTALKLFNTHNQWAVRAGVNFSLLTPGVKYVLRWHIRVVRKEKEGEAFWSGAYDSTIRKDACLIVPRIENIKDDDYHWYTSKPWLPAAGHYIMVWAAPGRPENGVVGFDAVYIDRLELVPVE